MADPYPEGSVTLDIDQWEVDRETGKVDYDLTMKGVGLGQINGPCDNVCCSWGLQAFYKDGETELMHYGLISGSNVGGTMWTIERSATDTAFDSREVTHLKAYVQPYSGSCPDPCSKQTYDTGFIRVSDPCPEGFIDLVVSDWRYEPSSGKSTYDLEFLAGGAKQINGPCESTCSWIVDAHLVDGPNETVHRLSSGTVHGGAWEIIRTISSERTLPPITHLRAQLIPGEASSGQSYDTGLIPVSPTTFEGHDLTRWIALLATVPRSDLCNGLLFYPGNWDTDSIPEPYEVCWQAVQAGQATAQVILTVLAVTGMAGLLLMVAEHHEEVEEETGSLHRDEPEGSESQVIGVNLPSRCIDDSILARLDIQKHHLMTNKHKTRYTALFKSIVEEVGLGLYGQWNVLEMKHQGVAHSRHYHEWVLQQLQRIRDVANKDQGKFVTLFNQWIEDVVAGDPLMVRREWWDCQSAEWRLRYGG